MNISATFSKYMNGQQVSAYDKHDNIIDGYVKVKEGKKYILSEDGKAYLMTEMKKIKQVGRRLNEEAKAAYADALQQFSDYYNSTFDTEKVEKANDNVKEKIVNQYVDTSDDSSVKSNKDAFIKDALNSMSIKAAEQQIENGNSTVDTEIEKLKKEAEKGELEESLFDNRRIQKAILKEMELDKTPDYGLSNKEDAIEFCSAMIEKGSGKDEIIQSLQLDYEFSKEEAEKLVNDLWIDGFNESDSKVDTEDFDSWEAKFEEALERVPQDLYGKNCVVEYLAECFQLDAQKALKESNDISEAIYNLVAQAKNR